MTRAAGPLGERRPSALVLDGDTLWAALSVPEPAQNWLVEGRGGYQLWRADREGHSAECVIAEPFEAPLALGVDADGWVLVLPGGVRRPDGEIELPLERNVGAAVLSDRVIAISEDAIVVIPRAGRARRLVELDALPRQLAADERRIAWISDERRTLSVWEDGRVTTTSLVWRPRDLSLAPDGVYLGASDGIFRGDALVHPEGGRPYARAGRVWVVRGARVTLGEEHESRHGQSLLRLDDGAVIWAAPPPSPAEGLLLAALRGSAVRCFDADDRGVAIGTKDGVLLLPVDAPALALEVATTPAAPDPFAAQLALMAEVLGEKDALEPIVPWLTGWSGRLVDFRGPDGWVTATVGLAADRGCELYVRTPARSPEAAALLATLLTELPEDVGLCTVTAELGGQLLRFEPTHDVGEDEITLVAVTGA